MPKPNSDEVFDFCLEQWKDLMEDPSSMSLDTPCDQLVIDVIVVFYDGNVHALDNAKAHVTDFFKKLSKLKQQKLKKQKF